MRTDRPRPGPAHAEPVQHNVYGGLAVRALMCVRCALCACGCSVWAPMCAPGQRVRGRAPGKHDAVCVDVVALLDVLDCVEHIQRTG